MEVKKLINEELLIIEDRRLDKTAAIQKLAERAKESNMITNVSEFVSAVLAREEESSTAIGLSVAIPHGKSDSVINPFVGFIRTNEFMQWDEEEVQLIFLIGVPKKEEGTLHLKILSNISRRLIDEQFRKQLMEAESEKEIYHLLSSIESKIS